ncbi:hypothetical protein SAMN04490244_103301 [Tranquillimonas rosea]|uniref:Methyltransferase domain-containing protein n=1 Tax=Tranquillimonas rosea TaxID=641238 RepID=A0A1H9SNG3_9RHOB|nr:hypothetical protein [Tranquillimonas rosea]SER86444.1 hypothetical protein SAMN04490244_103301 [Tranquillimonas rosea]
MEKNIPDNRSDIADRPTPWFEFTSDRQRRRAAECLSHLDEHYPNAVAVGSFDCAFMAWLIARCDQLTSLDTSDTPLETLLQRPMPPGLRLAKASMPFEWPEGRLDLIVLNEGIAEAKEEHIRLLAAHVARDLNPGGSILISTSDTAGSERREDALSASRVIRTLLSKRDLELTENRSTEGHRVDLLRCPAARRAPQRA